MKKLLIILSVIFMSVFLMGEGLFFSTTQDASQIYMDVGYTWKLPNSNLYLTPFIQDPADIVTGEHNTIIGTAFEWNMLDIISTRLYIGAEGRYQFYPFDFSWKNNKPVFNITAGIENFRTIFGIYPEFTFGIRFQTNF